ncbi:hypothetical protein [Luteimonas sp. J29]|nr:hypothetical protein [Luteimonas sp. J29]
MHPPRAATSRRAAARFLLVLLCAASAPALCNPVPEHTRRAAVWAIADDGAPGSRNPVELVGIHDLVPPNPFEKQAPYALTYDTEAARNGVPPHQRVVGHVRYKCYEQVKRVDLVQYETADGSVVHVESKPGAWEPVGSHEALLRIACDWQTGNGGVAGEPLADLEARFLQARGASGPPPAIIGPGQAGARQPRSGDGHDDFGPRGLYPAEDAWERNWFLVQHAMDVATIGLEDADSGKGGFRGYTVFMVLDKPGEHGGWYLESRLLADCNTRRMRLSDGVVMKDFRTPDPDWKFEEVPEREIPNEMLAALCPTGARSGSDLYPKQNLISAVVKARRDHGLRVPQDPRAVEFCAMYAGDEPGRVMHVALSGALPIGASAPDEAIGRWLGARAGVQQVEGECIPTALDTVGRERAHYLTMLLESARSEGKRVIVHTQDWKP